VLDGSVKTHVFRARARNYGSCLEAALFDDKVDVSVSRDADGNKHSQENTDQAKNQRHETDHSGGDNAREENQNPKERAALTADGLATVDYFA
jgi:hypothetical protein